MSSRFPKNNLSLVGGFRPQFFTKSKAVRFLSFFILVALLFPVIFFGEMGKVKAKTKETFESSAISQIAPPLFTVTKPDSALAGFALNLSNSFSAVSEFVTTPPKPEGLEPGKTISPAFSFFSSLGDSLLAVFGLFSTDTVSNVLPPPPAGSVKFDFDGDGRADLSRFRTASNQWEIKNSSNASTTNYTQAGKIVPGDYDGDSITDIASFDSGSWTINKSSGGQQSVSWGTSGDIPTVGDYDGDGKSDYAVYRPSTNVWWILQSSNGAYTSTSFGAAGDITAQGNFDGDSKTDIAIYRPSTGTWHISGSLSGYYTFEWGVASDIPVPADFDGDGKTDPAVYRGSTGTWYAYKSSTNDGSYFSQVWGNYGDQPVPADYDGDGKADFSIWRPTTGVWHTIKSSNQNYDYQTLGMTGDTAVPSAYLKQIGGQVFSYDLAKARLSPKNETGGTDLYSRNFGWGSGLAGLSGRAGLGAGFGISYNSLVWIKETESNSIYFDADVSNVSPGFRFGFPVIEPVYWDRDTENFSYLMIAPSGSRVEFKQIGASDTFETVDSSYVQLKTVGASNPNDPVQNITITVMGTDGTKMTYLWKAGAFRCSEIKDRNGNFISINHDEQGLLRTVTDTLGRVITVNYDAELYPTSITQNWKDNNGTGSTVQHSWATFSYTGISINTNFDSSLTVFGPPNGTSLKVLDKITYSNGSRTQFEYNGFGQVWKVKNIAADSGSHILNYVSTNLQTPSSNQTDCPRFTETRSWVENFNNNQETVITNSLTPNQSYSLPDGHTGTATKIELTMTNHPHGAISKTFVGESGWMEALPIATEDWANSASGSERKRWAWTAWTQDNENLSYIQNPRTIESKVGDTTNTKRATTEYRLLPNTTIAEYGLVSAVKVYDTDGATVLKKAETDYNFDAAYISRRIIGLPSETRSYGVENGALVLASKATFAYDEENFSQETNQNISSVIQHDNTNYSASFIIGRGNLTSTTRHDITGQTASVTSKIRYDIAGSPVAQLDPLNRKVRIEYADVFNDTTTTRNTFAYPTKVFDPANNYSEVKYRYDTGANIWAKSPAPAGNTTGKETVREYDTLGRLLKETLVNTGAYTRYEYPTNGIQSKVYATIIDAAGNGADASDEVYAESWTDGAGRTLRSRTEHPGSTGGWTGSLAEYDILGRVKRSTIPTEVNSNYDPAGDDQTRGWLWKQAEFDWKDRITREINTDGTDKLYSFDGCGCAGGQITTIQGEEVTVPEQTYSARRTQKIYRDILGRTYKTEVMNWDGTTPYTSALETFNERDQVVSSKQYDGVVDANGYCPTGTCQETTQTYDGHGRLATKHLPQQDAETYTLYSYNDDDSLQSETDARGATTHYTYNSRRLLSQKHYTVPTNSEIEVPATVNFDYDNVGNRIWMTDGLGRVDYEYDQLSRLKNEVRQFNDNLPQAPESGNKYRLSYTYTLSGNLASLTDPFSATIYYSRDRIGRLLSVTGTSYAGITNYASNAQYRAWGAIKHLEYGNQLQMNLTFNSRLQADSYSLNKYGQMKMQKQYQYYNDGMLSYSQDLLNAKFDRLNKYDQMGRVKEAYSGAEARGQTETNLQNQPYRQTYYYNPFGNLLGRNNKNWGANYDAPNITYVDNRMSGSTDYDAEGRLLKSYLGNYSYDITDQGGATTETVSDDISNTDIFDAAGRIETSKEMRYRGRLNWSTNQWSFETFESGRKIQTFDGDGLVVKSGGWTLYETADNDRTQVPSHNIYYIRSSILGGEIVSMARGGLSGVLDGKKFRTMVFADGTTLAYQCNLNGETVGWETKDASGASAQVRNSTGAIANHETPGLPYWQAERDPSGDDVGIDYYVTLPPPPPPFEPHPAGGFGFDWENYYPFNLPNYGNRRLDCIVDGVPGNRCDLELNNVMQGGASLDTRLNQRHLLAQFGYVEILRRKPIYNQTGGSTVVLNDDESILSGDTVTPTSDREIVGYQIESSWEVVSYTLPDNIDVDKGLPKNLIKAVIEVGNRPDCRDILSKMLNFLKGRETGYYSTDVEKLLERINEVKIDPEKADPARVGKGAVARIDDDKRNIYFSTDLSLSKTMTPSNILSNYVSLIFAELFHHARVKDMYGEKDFDDAAEAVINSFTDEEKKRFKPPTWKELNELKDKYKKGSGYRGHYFLSRYCNYSQEEVDNGIPLAGN
ncbi:hypothetical protein BH20ACI4_BH20ACI4_14220 [soil metagenome]